MRILAIGLAALAITALAQTASAQQSGPDQLTVVVPQEPPANDICSMASSAASRILNRNVGEGFTVRDEKTGELKPLLATAWKQTSPTTWEFTLRDGVVFHDGTPFTAETAVKSIERTFIPELRCSVASQAFGAVKLQPEALDEHTLKITTNQEDPILPLRTAYLGMTSPNSSRDAPTELPVGTGPFKVTSWQHGTDMTLERNDQYWGDKPSLAKVTYVFRADDFVRTNMVQTGEADVAIGLPPEQAGQSGIVSIDLPAVIGARVHIFSPPFNDIRLRQAIKLAIDRQGLIDAVWNGAGSPASQPITEGVIGYDASYPAPVYDPETAKKLVAAAKAEGVAVDTPSTLILRADIVNNGDLFGQALAEQLNNVGFNFKVQVMEAGTWITIQRSHPDNLPGVLIDAHDNPMGDGSWTANSKYHSSQARSQVPDDKRPIVDEMIKKAGGAQGEERERLFKELFAYLDEDVIMDVPIARPRFLMVLAPNVTYSPVVQSGDIFPLASMSKE